MMKKTMKTVITLMSAAMMLGTCAVPAFAGELTKEELIRKYAPDGAYSYADVYLNPCDFPTVMADGSTELEYNYVQKLEESGLSVDEQIEALRNRFYDFPDGKIYAYNDYRRGIEDKAVQWFVNAEYENGFWYVIQADGTASIVGADQAWIAENGLHALHIPSEIGGATVTKIEDNAFAYAVRFNSDLKEITVPDTVEIIGNGAFNSALSGTDCKLNLPQNVKYIGRLSYFNTFKFLMNEFSIITLPESVEFLGKRAFDSVNGLYESANGMLGHETHLDLFAAVDFVIDMPESPVFCEVSDFYIRNNADLPKKSYAGELSYKEKIKELDQMLADCGDNDELKERIGQMKAKCEHFAEAYDTDRMPRDVYVLLPNSTSPAMFLYNEYNAVTLDDVADFYARREAKPAPAANLAGDVNCSGAVDISDAVLLARFLNEDAGAIITDAGIVNADTDASGAVDAEDVIAIQRIIAKII